MDDIVRAAMAKWPNVPACTGWLGLDARGRWWLRDGAAQACGPFAGAGASRESRGSEVQHAKLRDFIGRNYAVDGCGRWYFQNGPQRVFVELERAPWVWRLEPTGHIVSHTGQPTVFKEAWLDETGLLYLLCDGGLGLVHTQDMGAAVDRVDSGQWPLRETTARDLLARCGVVLSPAAWAAQEKV